jgi:hypothetical protein
VSNASKGFSESIIALDASCSGVSTDPSCSSLPTIIYPPSKPLTTGNPVWSFATHPNGEIADLDLGATPQIFVSPINGQLLVGDASKDGSYYTVTAGPAPTGGHLVWTTKVVDVQTSVTTVTIGNAIGSALGGFIGSSGAAYGKVIGTTASGPEFLVALGMGAGHFFWDGLDSLSSDSAVGIANHLVFSGDNIGFLKAHDVNTGLLTFATFTGGPVTSGPVIADGMVFVGNGIFVAQLQSLPLLTHGVMAFAP